MKPQIRRLAETATALRAGTGTHFPITRLTGIKSLCKDPVAAAQFVFYLAERTLERMHSSPYPADTDPADWARHRALITEAVSLMRESLPNATPRATGRP